MAMAKKQAPQKKARASAPVPHHSVSVPIPHNTSIRVTDLKSLSEKDLNELLEKAKTSQVGARYPERSLQITHGQAGFLDRSGGTPSQGHMMNIVAEETIGVLREHGVPKLPTYDRALADACSACPPPFGRKEYGNLYRRSALDPDWVALSLLTAAQSEGEGARHLWDMAACTQDGEVARQIQQHSIEEARHSLGYVTLLGLIFPKDADEELRTRLRRLSPGYTENSPLVPTEGSPYAYPATVDELIQMNIAEIRTRIYHLLQRPILLGQYL